ILVPFFIQKIRYKKANIMLTKFEEINSEKEALNILKKKVYLANELLPKINKKSNEKELLGFKVIDKILGELGKISYINSQTTQKLIYVRKNEQEFCFPMHENFIINVNTKKRIMEVNIPKDLINLN
ncbi:MAG: 16S rRNA processing protein RimM, partial [Bacteroidota bacterium]|nr:16S rRNA processing protein RimM [Bacteroidota bacterium]